MSTTKVCIQCGAVYDIGQKFCPNDGSALRMQNADDPLIGQLVAERYQMISLIGEGGMGRVYCAEHVRMGRKSAVKVINPALATTADAIARFNREAANACRINHPNVAQVYDFGEMADGTLYLAMEYVDGETLDAVIARQGPLSVMRSAEIVKQVADALFAAHHLGIVHRDLKPENVMLASHLDGSDWVKVVDFGIAKTVQRDGGGSQTVTTAGVSLGTPEYMSPEQLAGERLDRRTDVYSLGLVLFNMLTGELPYPKVTSKETLVRRLTSKPRTLADVRPDIAWPQGLQAALDRAVAPEVGDRYDSVADFGRDVVRASTSPPAVATASTAPQATPASREPLASGSAPRTARDEAALESPLAHRRALPWAVATASLLLAVTIVAISRARSGESNPELNLPEIILDSAAFPADAQLPAPPAPAPVVPPTATTRASASASASSATGTHRAEGSDSQLATASRALSMVDSSRRVAGMLGRMVNIDSIMRQIGPEIERAQREARLRAPAAIANRHFWLRAGGDSAPARPLPRSAPLNERVTAAGEEVRAHIARMRQFFQDSNVSAGRLEFNSASSELAILRELAPGSPAVAQLELALAQAVRDVVVSCYQKQTDSTLLRGARCENLLGAPELRRRGVRSPVARP